MSRRVLSHARVLLSRKSPNERGAAALEFALVTPLLFTLIFGIISYGYMLSFRQGISQGAAEGARAAAVTHETDNAVKVDKARQALNRSLSGYDVSCESLNAAGEGTLKRGGSSVGTCTVKIAKCADSTQDCASVGVNYAYRSNPLLPSFPGVGATLPENLDYTAVAEVS